MPPNPAEDATGTPIRCPIFPLIESLTRNVERHPESEANVFREFIMDSWEVLHGAIVE